ncbi:MAG: fumarate hydratase [Clostridia bacterium]|nr:fumarate hydratase [Clostridia bacterium]
MRKINSKQIEYAVYRLALKAGVNLTEPCLKSLENSLKRETSASAKFALETVLENAETAKEQNMPVCQDTGVAVVLMEIGQEVFIEGKLLSDAVNDGVVRAYKEGYFRKSTCDPLTRENPGDNSPAFLHTEIVSGDKIQITFLPKGFGSENMSKLYMLTPADGVEGIIDAIVKTVELAGSRPCPPVFVGVGIGGTFDVAALNAKKALTRNPGVFSPREDVKYIEKTALEKINALGIGAQGFGGKITALGVSCLLAPTHISGLPVAVNIQCHAVRCEKGEI